MNYFFDTSVLKWSYIPGPHRRRCRLLISRASSSVHIAEISMLELVSALGAEVRVGHLSIKDFRKADQQFIHDIARGLIDVRPFPPSAYLPCRQLLAYVGIGASRNLRSQDAIIAYTAREFAIATKTRIRLLTSDRTLARIVQDIDIFRNLVDAEYLPRP